MEVYSWETPHILQQAVMTPEGNPPNIPFSGKVSLFLVDGI
jgi:hypothetical protein